MMVKHDEIINHHEPSLTIINHGESIVKYG
jgi:hypothetical protein